MTTPTLDHATYHDKVLACWLGKSIGGTLGAPFEWMRQANDVSFYTQDLGGEPMPNDDLDLQLAWLIALEQRGVDLDAHTLAEYWLTYVTPHWAEYGIGKSNLRAGVSPPWSGTLHNPYKHSCGAFIRSEIWACIAPGMPDVAAAYALQDAMVDHGDGEGTYAAVFCAAMQSAAFVAKDLREAVGVGLDYLPERCAVRNAVYTAIECADAGKHWKEARELILQRHRGSTAFNDPSRTSPEDREKGYHEGEFGFDVPSNIAILAFALLAGGTDFDQVMCWAVNCGEDTDCTAATAGATYGILHGTSAIPDRWIEPIGRSIKTACLNLGELGYFGNALPRTVNDLTDRTERVAQQVLLRHRHKALGPDPVALPLPPAPKAGWCDLAVSGPTYECGPWTATVSVAGGPFVSPGSSIHVQVVVKNHDPLPYSVSAHLWLPFGWSCDQGLNSRFHCPANGEKSLEFVLQSPPNVGDRARLAFQFTSDGRPLVLTVPLLLLPYEPTPSLG